MRIASLYFLEVNYLLRAVVVVHPALQRLVAHLGAARDWHIEVEIEITRPDKKMPALMLLQYSLNWGFLKQLRGAPECHAPALFEIAKYDRLASHSQQGGPSGRCLHLLYFICQKILFFGI